MVRRYNEQAQIDEENVRFLVQSLWKVDLIREGNDFSHADFLITDSTGVIGAIEIKRRNHRYGDYPTVFMALRKYRSLKNYKGNVYYFIKYNDCVRYIPYVEIDPTKIKVGGRFDRPDAPHDIEELIEIPISQLRVLRSDDL